MNPFYIKKFLEAAQIMNVSSAGKVNLNRHAATMLARASGLRSKKHRKIMKRCKQMLMKALDRSTRRTDDLNFTGKVYDIDERGSKT